MVLLRAALLAAAYYITSKTLGHDSSRDILVLAGGFLAAYITGVASGVAVRQEASELSE